MNPDKTSNTTLPLITIATVTYNAEATLQRTLDSVAAQDYARIEHLIVDGLSTDRTLSLVQRYVEQNDNRHQIRLISGPDEGLYDAMNKALTMATGEYIVFLNAGDKLHDGETISKVTASANWRKGSVKNPAVLYGETDLVDDKGKFLVTVVFLLPRTFPGKISSAACWFATSRSMLVQTSQKTSYTI